MGKRMSVHRGHIPLLVGEGKELKMILVHRKVLQHPYFFGLLELAAMEFGYDQKAYSKSPAIYSVSTQLLSSSEAAHGGKRNSI
ncbi:hypothetical protein EJB05_04199, partial [Eragrostis curvula]